MADDRYEYGINKASRVVIGIAGRVIVIVLFLIFLYLGLFYGFRFGRSLFFVEPVDEAPGRDVEITITENDTYQSLAGKLYSSGVIPDELSFVVQGSLYGSRLYPGTYTLNTSQTIREMFLYIDETASEYESQAEAESAANTDSEEVLTGGGESD